MNRHVVDKSQSRLSQINLHHFTFFFRIPSLQNMPENQVPALPSLDELWKSTEKTFGRRPCLWQLKVVQAVVKQDWDVILIAATGSGKTLTFWMPLLAKPNSVQIVCTPLNILGMVNVQSLADYGIAAINVTANNACHQIFQVSGDNRVNRDNDKYCHPGHCQSLVLRCADQCRDADEGYPLGLHEPLEDVSIH